MWRACLSITKPRTQKRASWAVHLQQSLYTTIYQTGATSVYRQSITTHSVMPSWVKQSTPHTFKHIQAFNLLLHSPSKWYRTTHVVFARNATHVPKKPQQHNHQAWYHTLTVAGVGAGRDHFRKDATNRLRKESGGERTGGNDCVFLQSKRPGTRTSTANGFYVIAQQPVSSYILTYTTTSWTLHVCC